MMKRNPRIAEEKVNRGLGELIHYLTVLTALRGLLNSGKDYRDILVTDANEKHKVNY